MPLILRIFIAMVLLAIAAFCAFGFLATFEPPGHWPLRITYGIVGLICIIGTAWLMMIKSRRLP